MLTFSSPQFHEIKLGNKYECFTGIMFMQRLMVEGGGFICLNGEE